MNRAGSAVKTLTTAVREAEWHGVLVLAQGSLAAASPPHPGTAGVCAGPLCLHSP